MVRRGERGSDRERVSRKEIEYIEKLIHMNRVAKVVRGGRRFRFSALVVVGDGKGNVGVGSGKAREMPQAVQKATENAKRSFIRISLYRGRTLHHDVRGHFGAGRVVLRSATKGTGIIAGGPMRAIFEAAGIQDIVAKSVGSSNPHNMAKATLDALTQIQSQKYIANKRKFSISAVRIKKDGRSQKEQSVTQEEAFQEEESATQEEMSQEEPSASQEEASQEEESATQESATQEESSQEERSTTQEETSQEELSVSQEERHQQEPS